VYVEDGIHDGKIITFEVMERPLIYAVAFEGIDSTQQAEVADEWRKQGIEMSQGSEYDQVRVRRAAMIIQELLNSQQSDNLKVMAYVEQQTATEVSVTFKLEKSS
jgi:outer membrane protein assembly factor BamA